jgi:predicted lipoprotein with Yx(FWY)xxD motif
MPGAASTAAPAGDAGINGSPNQGNLGAPDNGTPQQPGGTAADDQGIGDASVPGQGDGTGVSQNLILGISASQALGTYLSAYNGMAVYAYAPDKQAPGTSKCVGGCAAIWPPYTVKSASDIHVSPATTGKVSTITRADGSLQVTYNGQPLYFYAKDTSTSDTLGQGVGGAWSVVKP